MKGAAGASLYGTTAANGVIIIKTKRGANRDGVTWNWRSEVGASDLASIHYDPPLNQIRTEAPVTFEQGGRVTRGASFSSNLTFDNIIIRYPQGPASICSSGGM